ncbi:MAG: 4'-phosphopantetheinyl transferase superfamily protein [Casimicrobiaceae bacterium]
MKSFVGNDLIDLAAAHNLGRTRQPRFLDRALTVAERDRMAIENHGDYGFALLWSAKEAAYKAAKKHDLALVFAPRRWQVNVDSLVSSAGDRKGSVVIAADTHVAVRWQQGSDWLHCVALLGEPPSLLDQAVAVSTELESSGNFHPHELQRFACMESDAVRNLAKRLLQHHGISKIEILRASSGAVRLPPKVYAGATPLSGIDLSLSHDGRFVAAAITVDREVIGPR